MLVLFHRIAYIEAAPGMYFREKTGLVEGNPVYHLSGSVVNKLKFDMLHLAAHEFARAVRGGYWTIHIPRTGV